MEQAVLVDISKNLHVQDIILSSNKFLIGRGLHNSRVIDDIIISRTHCVLEYKDENWYIFDKSSNGTQVNGNFVNKEIGHKLIVGDVVCLSDSIIFIFQTTAIKNNTNTSEDTIKAIENFNKHIIGDRDANNDENVPPINHEEIVLSEEQNPPINLDVSEVEIVQEIEPVAKEIQSIQEQPTTSTDNSKQQYLNFAEDELQCSICTEMFIKATTLECSHTFCKYCIFEWKKSKSVCPICRTKIANPCPTLVLDNFIEKILKDAGEEVNRHRSEVIKSRNSAMSTTSTIPGKKESNESVEVLNVSSDDDSEDSDFLDSDHFDEFDEVYDYEYEYDSDDYNGIPGHYYGGYGYCFSCGQTGHWSRGCPFKRRRV